MNDKPPAMRRKSNGAYSVKWGGKERYLAMDREEAQAKYLGELEAWAKWRKARNERRLPPMRVVLTVRELYERFLESREAEGGVSRREFYRIQLRRFLASYDDLHADGFRPTMLQRLKDNMLRTGKAPKTINHDIQAVRTMFQWAMDLELIPPVNLRGVKKLPLGPIPDKTWSLVTVRDYILVRCRDDRLRPWLAINYLAAMRPIEVLRAAHGEYTWDGPGLMRMKNKAEWRSRLPRVVLFSDEALEWLEQVKPRWSVRPSYSHACLSSTGTRGQRDGDGPHRLRHSAGTHLLQSGVRREDADSILGHYPSAVSLAYMPLQWQRLRETVGRLTLRDSLPISHPH